MRSEVAIKAGDTLGLTLQFMIDDGTVVDISTAQLSCQVRDALGNLVAIPAIALGADPGIAILSATDTSQWPVGVLRADLKVSMGGVVAHSQTLAVRVERAVTT